MHIQKLRVRDIRTIKELNLDFEKRCAGWHVILGDNGSGKSSVIRALALALIGPGEVAATRQDWPAWIRSKASSGRIEALILQDPRFDNWVGKGRSNEKPIGVEVDFIRSNRPRGRASLPEMKGKSTPRTIWGGGAGWFSASFGPFRRFSGGDKEYDRLFLSNPGLAPHLSAFGEDVALGEALKWLQELQFKSYESNDVARRLLKGLIDFLGQAQLPHGSCIKEITSDAVIFCDGAGVPVPVEQLSDGFRSVLSMTFELLRGMVVAYGNDVFLDALEADKGIVGLPGIVGIDEVDAHLHPAWQKRIGDWLMERFPMIQFIVTTHSPIICRSSENGSIWRLPTPGTEEESCQIVGRDRDRLVYGSVLDAFDTRYFGKDVTRSKISQDMMKELASLNLRRSRGPISESDEKRRKELQGALPSVSAIL